MMRRAAGLAALALIVAACGTTGTAAQGVHENRMTAPGARGTLARVRAAGELRCGIDVEEAEYTTADDHGNHAAFDKDLCRAVAAAVLGDNARVKTADFPDDRTAMDALAAGAVDVVATLPLDFSHTAGTHLAATRPVLWDGIGFLVPAGSAVRTERQLSGKKICLLAETQVEEHVRGWFHRQGMNYQPFPFQEEGEMQAAFSTGNCGALAGERTRLAQTRAALAQHGETARLLPGEISHQPLAMFARGDDAAWVTLLDWVAEALVAAEEIGITRQDVTGKGLAGADVEDSGDAERRFLLGGSREVGARLGLDDAWVVRVVRTTGNYGEIYERDLGFGSPLRLPRGPNRLYEHGGRMMALPFE